jgi:enoyl-CoA hydratase
MTTQAESRAAASGPDQPVVLYRRAGDIAVITLNRPEYRNAQNSAMTYALDEAFYRGRHEARARRD